MMATLCQLSPTTRDRSLTTKMQKKRLAIAGLAENHTNKRTQRAQFSENAISNAVVILSFVQETNTWIS